MESRRRWSAATSATSSAPTACPVVCAIGRTSVAVNAGTATSATGGGGLVVELDGRAAHPEDERELDDLRDNEIAECGERTLRYGWRSVTGMSCQVARQVWHLLQQGGWSGRPTRCGQSCTVDSPSTEVIAVVQRP